MKEGTRDIFRKPLFPILIRHSLNKKTYTYVNKVKTILLLLVIYKQTHATVYKGTVKSRDTTKKNTYMTKTVNKKIDSGRPLLNR